MSDFCCTDPACFCGGYKGEEAEIIFEAVSLESYEKLEQEIQKLKQERSVLVDCLMSVRHEMSDDGSNDPDAVYDCIDKALKKIGEIE